MSTPPDELLARVERLTGAKPGAWHAARGGYSVAERWSLDLIDGRRVFAKMATKEFLAGFLRDEHRKMSMVDPAVRCEIVAWEDGEQPLLVLEDLRDGYWPPPWRPGDVDRAREALEQVWATPADDLPDASRIRGMFAGWDVVERDPSGFLSLGIASADWTTECVRALAHAARDANYDGNDFVHMDVRSDNLCLLDDRVVLVDWNWAIRGPRELDLAAWACSLRLEGGPLPDELVPGLGGYAAGIAGFFAANAPLPAPEGAPTVRRFQLRQLRIAVLWACRELGLPLPDVPWARDEIAAADTEFDAGRIDEPTWHARVEEPLIDAYLAAADPRAQSGKGGDEASWRWSRELILDVFPPRATFLDVGCANGYLMESVHRWGRERGIDVEPYGLDISWRICALARMRLPQWADRIFTGNVMDWEPPRRFDVVQLGIDEVPVPRRRELVRRVLDAFVVPGGKLVFRAGRVGDPRYATPDEQLDALGIRPDGIIERVHPSTGELRRTAWLDAPVP